ncbi:MAG: hypothetical protein HPY76_15295, partial [Anaerolineae bacterium]|nr:hypothetical protein [Anaerolineae bacterium]
MTRIAKNPLVQRFVQWMSAPLSPWLVALGLLVIGALAYGVHIPTWGLYGDDWIYLYSYHAAGAGSFIDFVRADRPFSFWIYTLITPILGESIWAYHLLLLLVRWAGALLLIWVIQLISPRHRHLAVAAAVLFLVYPGFGQQPVALQFILHFTVLALTIFSFAAMIKGAGDERPWLWRALSWFSALVSLFSLEYFVGYELMRPVVLWIVYGRTGDSLRARIRRVGASWLPFVLIGGVFAAWRVLIFKFPFYQPETLTMIRQSPAAGISALLARLLADLKVVLYDAWRQTLTLPSGDRSGYLLLAGLAFLVMFLLMKRTVRATTARSGGFAFVWFSLLLLLVGGIPFWVTDIPVALSFPWDRATLPFMLGAALFTSGMLDWLLRPVFLPYALALLVALAVGYH